ncbi:hypothetical protein PINS_up007855 [Pythium insidiosum]|nr:hypothetical protein PINS_up007855 [Pythium insidiosum]
MRLYVIAGEASGDAIGAKVLAALRRTARSPERSLDRLTIRGIGGPLMCAEGRFESLFPMHELSVMGLVEVLPAVWRIRRRLNDTIQDIRAFQPDVVLTIDSKGFSFRVQRALADDPSLRQSVKRMHYVAPSVWAYKHRQRRSAASHAGLRALLDKMFVILPFEPVLFNTADEDPESAWCQFVGHPAVEDFLDVNGAFDREIVKKPIGSSLETEDDALLRSIVLNPGSLELIRRRGELFHALMADGRDAMKKKQYRQQNDFPSDAFIVCALVGSRENEVRQTIRIVLQALEQFHEQPFPRRPASSSSASLLGMQLSRLTSGCVSRRPIHIVFPTIQNVEDIVQEEINQHTPRSSMYQSQLRVVSNLDAASRSHLFQSADAAIAVSGTIVTETALSALPTIVIYRANRITEWLATKLSAVRFVSIPNLLLGRPVIPELLFRNCSSDKIADALRGIYNKEVGDSTKESDQEQIAMAMSTLSQWTHPTDPASRGRPTRGSDQVAEFVWTALTDSIRTKR